MGLSFWQIAVVAILFLLLFGRGKLPALMSDLAEGITNFRKGLSKNETSDAPPEDRLERKPGEKASSSKASNRLEA